MEQESPRRNGGVGARAVGPAGTLLVVGCGSVTGPALPAGALELVRVARRRLPAPFETLPAPADQACAADAVSGILRFERAELGEGTFRLSIVTAGTCRDGSPVGRTLALEGEAERRGSTLELEDESGPARVGAAGTVAPNGRVSLAFPGGSGLEFSPRLEG